MKTKCRNVMFLSTVSKSSHPFLRISRLHLPEQGIAGSAGCLRALEAEMKDWPEEGLTNGKNNNLKDVERC